MSIHRKKVSIIEFQVINGTEEQSCANSNNDVIMNPLTEKAVKEMVNLSEGMSTGQVAEILGVSERTVRNICKLKQLVHYKVGTRIVVLPEDLTNYIHSLKIEKVEEK